MRLSVFGLGYVGAVSCGCFAQDGFDVTGVDAAAAMRVGFGLLVAGGAAVAVPRNRAAA